MPKYTTFAELAIGDRFELNGSFCMKIQPILMIVENPLHWQALGKQCRVNAICIEDQVTAMVGRALRISDDLHVNPLPKGRQEPR